MNAKGFTLIETVLVIAIVAILIAAIAGTISESRKWASFAKTHNCKVVGQQQGDVGVGYGGGSSGGLIVVSTSGKTGYLCDDGVTYWRNK